MPLIIPEQIPAYQFLQKSAFVMGAERAIHQDIRPLEVLIINLMPTKIETENQILSLLANSPLQVNITLLTTQSYIGKNTPQSHLDRFYVNFEDIKGRNFDGAIVTGAPIEHLAYEEVKYWDELVSIMSYLRCHCTSTLYLCWGAMAGLYYFHRIDKISLPQKLFGIFDHYVCEDDVLLSGLDEVVRIPHSRHSGIDELALARKNDLKVLLRGEQSGTSMLRDSQDVFILGHPEYTKETLYNEYQRDLSKGLSIESPQNYFNTHGQIVFSWRSSASVIFSNWLNFSVYQDTPFILH